MDGRAWNSGYQVTVDGWQSSQWAKSIREVTRIFNEHGIQVSHSKVYQIQAQRDDLEAGRPNTRVIRPLPKQAQFHAFGKRGGRWVLRLMLLKWAIMPIYYAKIMPPHTNEWG